ncbi:MAG: T9SS type A sorting domain-containing protein, partial [Candidatus Marinimicrobia bacterium]|nr:T9SS type A sorting domain-containing protein [Candidatus Neomarinimicrobiota bacterium]
EPSEDSPGPDMVELIVNDPDISGNKLFQYEQPTSAYKRMYKALFNEYWKGTDFTLIVRTKTLPDYDQGMTFQWRHGNANARDDLRFYLSTGRMWLEYSTADVYPDFSFLDWHTYRIAVYGDSAAVFVDEELEPVITGVTSSTTSDHYFKFGDRGSGTVGGLLDWLILDISGAYAPGGGVPIPEGLFVDEPEAIDDDLAVLPKKFSLSQNYPNPFNPTTVIQYEVPRPSEVIIKLYDILGREVMTMVNKEQAAGRYSLTLDANRLASGIYFYTMQADNFMQTKKMILLK